MAKAMVKCVYCGQQFDRNAEPFVAINSRRYAHQNCYDKNQATKTQDEKDYEELCQYIKQKFYIQTISAKITRQISDYKKQYNFSYSGMLKALKWWFDVKHNTLEGTNGGIGILPYIYNDARTYYYGLYLAQAANKDKVLNIKVEEIEIAPPQPYIKPPKLFNIGEEVNEE
jgi:hypothetical protein